MRLGNYVQVCKRWLNACHVLSPELDTGDAEMNKILSLL